MPNAGVVSLLILAPYLLWATMIRIQVPLAISPVVFFAAVSLLLSSIPLAVAALLLGVSHIPLSLRDAKSIAPIKVVPLQTPRFQTNHTDLK